MLRNRNEEPYVLQTAVDQLHIRLRSLVNLMNKSENVKSQLTAWIDKYDGKIIGFQVGNAVFHLVVTKENVAFVEGSYPSADAIMVAEPQLIINILSGKIRLSSSLIADDTVRVWGNFHDLTSLFRIISSLHKN